MTNPMNDFEEPSKEGNPAAVFAFLGAVFFLGTLLAFTVRALLTRWHQRFSVVASVVLIIEIFLVLFYAAVNPLSKFLHVVENPKDISSDWPSLLPLYIVVSLALGGVVGLLFVAIEIRTLKKNPHRLQIQGNWAYKFQYRRTPLQVRRRKTHIAELTTGELVSEEKAPLGLLDNTSDEIVSRYYPEARLHTFITGASGSGKALEENTLLPTPLGMRKVRDVKEGDELYDEHGIITRVLARYEPETNSYYRVLFADGTQVLTCGDHLWEVTVHATGTREVLSSSAMAAAGASAETLMPMFSVPVVSSPVPFSESTPSTEPRLWGEMLRRGRRRTLPTTLLFSSVAQRSELLAGLLNKPNLGSPGENAVYLESSDLTSDVRLLVCSLGYDPSPIRQTEIFGDIAYFFTFSSAPSPSRAIVDVRPIESESRYFCFTVDSPSHLFLCSESFIPTHNTVSMQTLIRSDIANGIPTVIIDFKRSPEFASKMASWTKEFGGDFYHFANGEPEEYDIVANEHGQALYDPLAGTTPTSMADMVLGMREYDTASAVYRANMQQLLQVLSQALFMGRAVKRKTNTQPSAFGAGRDIAASIDFSSGTLMAMASAIKQGNLEVLAEMCRGTPIERELDEVVAQVNVRSGGLQHAAEELRGQLRTIMASEYGQWLKTIPDERAINLYELSKKKGSVVLFSLNSDSEPEFASYMGSLIMADLTNVSAKRRNEQFKNHMGVYIDEFQVVNPSSVTGLLEKSRESAMAVTLAQQSFEQVIASSQANGEAYLLSILDTCSNFITHNGSTEGSAERLSKILGKEWVTAYRASNQNKSFFLSFNFNNKRDSVIQTSEEEKWVFAPREFLTLSSPSQANGFRSTAVLINKVCSEPAYAHQAGAVARRVWVVPPAEVLTNYYKHGQKRPQASVSQGRSHISLVDDEGDALDMNTFDMSEVMHGRRRPSEAELSPLAYEDVALTEDAASDEEEEDFVFTPLGEAENDDTLPAPMALPFIPRASPPRKSASPFDVVLPTAGESPHLTAAQRNKMLRESRRNGNTSASGGATASAPNLPPSRFEENEDEVALPSL